MDDISYIKRCDMIYVNSTIPIIRIHGVNFFSILVSFPINYCVTKDYGCSLPSKYKKSQLVWKIKLNGLYR